MYISECEVSPIMSRGNGYLLLNAEHVFGLLITGINITLLLVIKLVGLLTIEFKCGLRGEWLFYGRNDTSDLTN